MFCSKWTSHHMSHPRLCLQCKIAQRKPFLQNKSSRKLMAIAELYLKVVLSPSYLNNTMFTIYCDADVCIDINKSKKN